jgi:hypothetical protein
LSKKLFEKGYVMDKVVLRKEKADGGGGSQGD